MTAIATHGTIGSSKLNATLLGFGTSTLGNMFSQLSEGDVQTSLQAAWEGGVRIFDTAPFYGYGLSERRLGDFLRTKPRDEYLLCNKVGRLLKPRGDEPPSDTLFISTLPFNVVYDYTYDGAMRSYEDSLQRMGLDRFDILLIHDIGVAEHGEAQPRIFKQAMDGAAKALFELRNAGEISAVGVGTNEWEVAEAALRAADFDTFLLAGRYTLLEQHSATTFMPLCIERNVRIMLGGAYNSGLLVSKDIRNSTWNYKPAPQDMIERALHLRAICERHGAQLPAAALQFAMAHPAVASVIVGLRSEKEASESLHWIKQGLPGGLWQDFVDEGMLDSSLPFPRETGFMTRPEEAA